MVHLDVLKCRCDLFVSMLHGACIVTDVRKKFSICLVLRVGLQSVDGRNDVRMFLALESESSKYKYHFHP